MTPPRPLTEHEHWEAERARVAAARERAAKARQRNLGPDWKWWGKAWTGGQHE